MSPKVTFTLRQALRQLEAERQRIDRQISAIRSVLGETGQQRKPTRPAAHPGAKTSRPRMSAAARRAVSQRMKAYWVKRRAAKANATGKP
jgi:tagatose-1,6-bisphosphate aldolase non-catalytic subunit AgaZ/GatZ